MIDLKGKTVTENLLKLLEQHGYCTVDGVPTSTNDAACQAIIDAWDELPDYRDVKIAAIKADGLARIQAVLPGISDLGTLEVVREQWISIAPAARQPTASMSSVINIYTAARNAITSVKAADTKAAVDAVTPIWP